MFKQKAVFLLKKIKLLRKQITLFFNFFPFLEFSKLQSKKLNSQIHRELEIMKVAKIKDKEMRLGERKKESKKEIRRKKKEIKRRK